MEAVLVVLRPKQHATVSQDFRPRAFDILLTDIQVRAKEEKLLFRVTRSIIKLVLKEKISLSLQNFEFLKSDHY